MIENPIISFKSNGFRCFCYHLGILIFAPYLNKLAENGLAHIGQWLVSVLLGCQNIEQGKELNYASLEKLIGKANKTLRLQRVSLKEASSLESTKRVLQFNAKLLEVDKQRDFYYGPHTKHCTGHLKILATWCSSVRLADKGLNMDYVHTTSGHPVYFSTDDNFKDLRERFAPNTKAFRSICGFAQDSVLTWVIDRGIYSLDVFKDIVKDPGMHILTWEKGHDKNLWDEKKDYGKGSIIRERNKKGDTRLVNYHYQEGVWDKHPSIKQLIVRLYDKNHQVAMEVPIITDDMHRPADQLIKLMFNRWLQENDFKYMIKHFGLDQLTSYAFTDYKDLKDKIEDKLYTCTEHKVLTKEIKKVRAKLKTALLRKHYFQEKHKQGKELIAKEKRRKERIWKYVTDQNALLDKMEMQRKKTTKNVSKIEELTDQGYKKLDTNTKDFMDAIKILARNIFYLSFQPFKEMYNNYRDDHVLFRHLTRAGGMITLGTENCTVELHPQMEYQPKVKKYIAQVLDQINSTQPKLPDGSARKLKIYLKN